MIAQESFGLVKTFPKHKIKFHKKQNDTNEQPTTIYVLSGNSRDYKRRLYVVSRVRAASLFKGNFRRLTEKPIAKYCKLNAIVNNFVYYVLKCCFWRDSKLYSEEKVSVIRNFLITAGARLPQEITFVIPDDNTENGESIDEEVGS